MLYDQSGAPAPPYIHTWIVTIYTDTTQSNTFFWQPCENMFFKHKIINNYYMCVYVYFKVYSKMLSAIPCYFTCWGCYLIACPLRAGDIILYEHFAGEIICWFEHPHDGLYVRVRKLDLVDRTTWGSKWKVSNDTVDWRISTTSTPDIPTWYTATLATGSSSFACAKKREFASQTCLQKKSLPPKLVCLLAVA